MASSSLVQGLSLLDAAVAQERRARPGLNASRLSEHTEIERSRVSRLTQELRARQFLTRDDDALFSAGPAFFGTAAVLNAEWLRAARVALRALAAQLGVNALITVADGARGVLLRYERSRDGSDRSIREGLVTPIWCTGAGRALLWDHTPEQLEALLDDVQFIGVGGPTAARSTDDVRAMQVRDIADGLISASEEYDEGIDEFALPIRRGGAVIASLAVRGRHRSKGATKETRALLAQFARELTAAADGA
ncbi:MAG: IclR family transcriptional regulator C-terminal domain-containing protein [Candidatus Microbacterium colombiense]|nr:MAG: IclR family transcriptional regulator C-terminal domain-containing protein [Microbacterium sp.]